MSVLIKDFPALKGKDADRFIEKIVENSKNAGSIDFKEQAEHSRKIMDKNKSIKHE